MDKDKTVTKEQFRAMGYAERLALKQSNPEQYRQLSRLLEKESNPNFTHS